MKNNLHRDKTTWISYLQVSFFAWFIFSFGAFLPFIREELNLSATVASLHSATMAIGSVSSGFLTSRLIDRIGRGQLLRYTTFGLMFGLILIVTGQQFAITMIGAMLCGYSGSTIVQSTGAYLSTHHGRFAPTVISEQHALAAGIGVIAPILVGITVAQGWGWRPATFVAIVALFVIEISRGKDVSAYGAVRDSAAEQSVHHDLPGSLPRIYWWAWAAVFCTAAVEFSVMFWASYVLRDQGGMGAAASAAALGSAVGGMFLGRFTVARTAGRLGSENLYRASLLIALLGFLVFWRSTSPTVLLVSLFIAGIGIGAHFPLGLDRVVRASAGRPDKGSSFIALGAGTASGAAPFALGALSEVVGIQSAYTIVPIALVAAIFIAFKAPVPTGEI